MRRIWNTRWERAFVAAFLILLVVSGVLVHRAYWQVRRLLPAYLNQKLSEALGRPVTVGRVGFRLPATFTVRDLRVEALPTESRAPLTSREVRAGISWWDLIAHQRLRVTGLTLMEPQVVTRLDLRKQPGAQTNPAAGLLALRRAGLERIAIRKGEAEVLTTLPAGNEETVHAHLLDFSTELKPHRFDYQVSADKWSGAGLEATKLRLAGTGDEAGTITVRKSSAQFRGGQLQARGTYVGPHGDVAMQVRVKGMPIRNLSAQLGIPAEWNFEGNVTGTVDLSATSGALRRVQGQVQVARGFVSRSQATFPWTSAIAQVDWKPEGIRLDRINVQGNGLRLEANARIGGKPGESVASRPYQADGTVSGNSTKSVAALARLLAFSAPVPGRWDLGQASIRFTAQGIVGELAQSRASGKFQASNFMVRPVPDGAPLVVRTISGDVTRGPHQLLLENVTATADGLQGSGKLVVVPTVPGTPGKFSGSGKLDFASLATLQQQLPGLPLWNWLHAARPEAKGAAEFAVNGPTQHPERAAGSGTFRMAGFDVSVPVGGGSVWTFPIRGLDGSLKLEGTRLAVNDLHLRSDLFTGGGALVLSPVNDRGKVTGQVRLASQRWQELPPLERRVPAGLTGGTLVLETRLDQAPLKGGRLPVAGEITLQNATYTGTIKGVKRTTRLDAARVDFKTAGDRIFIPGYRLHTPLFATSGTGTLKQVGNIWLADARGNLTAADAGAVMRWWSGKASISGGDLHAGYHLSTPPARPKDLDVQAQIRLAGAQPLLAAGSLPFKPEDARIISLTGKVSVEGRNVHFSDAVWKAPRFTARGSGLYDGNLITADLSLATDEWRGLAEKLAQSLPVSGGTLTVSGHLHGSPRRLRLAPLTGTLALRGAHLTSGANASVPVPGGRVDLLANVNGTVGNLVGSDVKGHFSIRDLLLPAFRPGSQQVRLKTLRGDFDRTGTRVLLSNLAADATGAQMTGSGELRGVGTGKASHQFQFATEGPALAGLLPALLPLPGKASGGAFDGTLTLTGNARSPFEQMEGRVHVKGGEWTPPAQTEALHIRQMAAHFVRRGENATLDETEVKVVGGSAQISGTVQGLDTAAGPHHTLQVAWRLEDASAWASRFFPVPGQFTGGLFTGNARVSGNSAAPAQSATGDFVVSDAGFMPPAKVVGGPVRPISVHMARGLFSRSGGKTELTKLQLDTSVGTATGTVSAMDRGSATIQAEVNISVLDSLIDLWPGFKGRIAGGHGQMKVALHGPLRQPRKLAGTVDIRTAGGTLTAAGLDPLYGEQPFEELSARMTLQGNGAVAFRDVKMRGPRANLDGIGRVLANGVLEGKGEAWFTKDYTKKLVKPRILYPVAKLFGHGKLHSHYELHGTLASARLDMGIKDSVFWKLGLKRKVPEPLRDMATGKTPLWGSPAGVDEKVAGVRMETRRKK